ncbi:DUF2232 domain-containing protein [Roseospira goensis]|uniref:DUF2232 domain-containing protein n=1 Tax=Roseospira goensis TaxID=391922 RepID=A0A7W6S072_9PROT|nr:DUF2232 domain-containing protein [Roseospira goensis]MBB4285807.1 hypothetical protein [Roseospira goensis]
MPQTVLIALAAGIAGALLYAAMLALGPVAGAIPWFLSPVPLLLAGFTLGRAGGFVACGVGALAFGLVSLSGGAGTLYLLSDALPAALVVAWALRPAPGLTNPAPARSRAWMPAGTILARLALLPPLGMVVLALLAPSHADGLQGLLREQIGAGLDRMLAEAGSGAMPALDGATRGAVLDSAVQFLPGGMAMSWLFRIVVAAVLAQALAQRLGRAVRPSPAYGALELPAWYGAVFAAVVLASVVLAGDAGYVAWSAALGLSLPFLLLGFKLVHQVARRTPQPTLVLVVFYIVFLSVSAVAIVAMVLAGLVEYAATLRRRAAGRASEEE